MRLAIALLFACAALNRPATTAQRFTSGVEAVTVDVLVSDGRKPIGGLTSRDFELRDNGVVQHVAQLDSGRLPLNVILALDVSASVAGTRFERLREAAASFIGKLRPQDRVGLLTFSHQLRLPSPLTADRELVRKALDTTSASGHTALRDAAYMSIALRGAEPGRTLIVLFTDGIDTASFLDDRHVLNAARRSDVIIYPVAVRLMMMLPFGRRRTATNNELDEPFLTELAKESGGRLVIADSDRDIGPVFERILDEFNSRYLLAYTPTGVSGGGWHQVDVRLKSKKGKVTARRGYFSSLP